MYGLAADSDKDPPTGWRVDAGHGHWVPDKRTKLGKQLAAEMAEVKLSSQSKPLDKFIPMEHHDGPRWYSAGCQYIAGAVYVTHNAAFQFESNEYFQQIPLSQYYAALETEEKAGA